MPRPCCLIMPSNRIATDAPMSVMSWNLSSFYRERSPYEWVVPSRSDSATLGRDTFPLDMFGHVGRRRGRPPDVGRTT